MSQKQRKHDGRLYFTQTDYMRPIGAVLLVGGLVWFFVGYSMISYYAPSVMVPVGLVLFIVGSVRHVSDSDVTEACDRLLLDYDRTVTDMDNYDRRVLKQPADVVTSAYLMGEGATCFKRNKGNTVISDIYVRSHFFFTKEALLVCARRVSLTEMDAEQGMGFCDLGGSYAFSDITSARMEDSTVIVTLTNTKKTATVHRYELILEGHEGELLRLPVENNMDVSTLCEEINRRVSVNASSAGKV